MLDGAREVRGPLVERPEPGGDAPEAGLGLRGEHRCRGAIRDRERDLEALLRFEQRAAESQRAPEGQVRPGAQRILRRLLGPGEHPPRVILRRGALARQTVDVRPLLVERAEDRRGSVPLAEQKIHRLPVQGRRLAKRARLAREVARALERLHRPARLARGLRVLRQRRPRAVAPRPPPPLEVGQGVSVQRAAVVRGEGIEGESVERRRGDAVERLPRLVLGPHDQAGLREIGEEAGDGFPAQAGHAAQGVRVETQRAQDRGGIDEPARVGAQAGQAARQERAHAVRDLDAREDFRIERPRPARLDVSFLGEQGDELADVHRVAAGLLVHPRDERLRDLLRADHRAEHPPDVLDAERTEGQLLDRPVLPAFGQEVEQRAPARDLVAAIRREEEHARGRDRRERPHQVAQDRAGGLVGRVQVLHREDDRARRGELADESLHRGSEAVPVVGRAGIGRGRIRPVGNLRAEQGLERGRVPGEERRVERTMRAHRPRERVRERARTVPGAVGAPDEHLEAFDLAAGPERAEKTALADTRLADDQDRPPGAARHVLQTRGEGLHLRRAAGEARAQDPLAAGFCRDHRQGAPGSAIEQIEETVRARRSQARVLRQQLED